jgi:hypothetical protein
MFIWIGLVRFLVEFLRIENWRIGNIPTAQYFGAAFVLLGIGILVYRRRAHAPALVPVEGEARPDDYVPRTPAKGDGGGDNGDDAGDFDEFEEFDAARGSDAGTASRATDDPGEAPPGSP